MKHASPPLTTAESYARQYALPLETVERLLNAGAIR